MDQGYKHFSHQHNLVIHRMPEGVNVPCSGCNSPATQTVYVCWACNYFLHEQCYRATRSLKHPSHPPHPLTLVPYPTYPSNSFYCNSCHVIGTGFSYSCADCEFDLHVQCATYSIPFIHAYDQASVSIPTSFHHPIATGSSVSIPSNYPSPPIFGGQDHLVTQSDQKANIIMHFSHPHNLFVVNLKDKENNVICAGCKGNIVGKCYLCSVPNCNFHLHESCFHLRETVKRPDHEHMLKLFYSCPVKGEDVTVSCDVCHGAVQKDRWAYYCESCDFDTHLGCVDSEKREKDSDVDTQVQLQRLQLEMQMNQQLAQMIAGMGASISSLAG